MPPPLLAQILCLLIYQTGRRLLTFCGWHTSTRVVELGPSPSFQKNGDHYCCRQQLFCVCTLSQCLTLLALSHSSVVLSRGFNPPGCRPGKRFVCLQQWNCHTYHFFFLLWFFCCWGLKCDFWCDGYYQVRKRWKYLLRIMLQVGFIFDFFLSLSSSASVWVPVEQQRRKGQNLPSWWRGRHAHVE